jgi:hypothetical protein
MQNDTLPVSFTTGAFSGAVTVQNAVATNQPATLGQVLPAASISNFLAYQSTAQSIVAATSTSVQFQTKLFDDLGEFNATNGTFSPLVAGTYVLCAGVTGSQSTATSRAVSIYVNGFETVRLQQNSANAGWATMSGCSGPIKLAVGDVIAIYYYTGLADTLSDYRDLTYFGGYRIK